MEVEERRSCAIWHEKCNLFVHSTKNSISYAGQRRESQCLDVEANFIHTNLLKIALFLGGFGAALQQDS